MLSMAMDSLEGCDPLPKSSSWGVVLSGGTIHKDFAADIRTLAQSIAGVPRQGGLATKRERYW